MIHNALKKLIYAFAIGALLTSCGETNNKLQGYEWLEGEWYGESDLNDGAVRVIVTKDYYQIACDWWGDVSQDVKDVEKNDIDIKKRTCIITEPPFTSLSLDESIWISKKDKNIYLVQGEYAPFLFLKKIKGPVIGDHKKGRNKNNLATSGSADEVLSKSQYKRLSKRYDEISYFSEGFARIWKDGNVGFINNSGDVVLEPFYSDASDFYNGYARVADSHGKWGLLNNEGNEAVPPKYDLIDRFGNTSYLVKKSGRYGFIDNDGSVITDIKYDAIEPLNEGVYKTVLNSRYGLVNSEGKEIAPPEYVWIGVFEEGVARCNRAKERMGNSYWGLIKSDGTELVPPKYHSMDPFENGLARVNLIDGNNHYGLINRAGEEVVPLKYIQLNTPFTEGMASFKTEDGKLGYIDSLGKEAIILPDNYLLAEPFKNGYAKVAADVPAEDIVYYITVNVKRWGFVDKKGNIVVEPKYRKVDDCYDGVALVTNSDDENYGYVNMQGVEIAPLAYYKATRFCSGLAAVKHKGSAGWGYINTQGELTIPYQFFNANPFSCGLARVSNLGGGYYYINISGEKVSEEFPDAHDFSEGYASVLVRDGGQSMWGFIDTTGHIAIPPQYYYARDFSEGLAAVKMNKTNASFGYIDQNAWTIIPAKFNQAEDFHNGTAIVHYEGKWQSIDKEGNTLGIVENHKSSR